MQGTRCHSSASGRCRTRPAACSTSFPTVFSSPAPSPSGSPFPSTLDQCDNNATSALAFASARQTRCASRPAGTHQSAYPATHTHTQTHALPAKVCLCCICKCANQTCSPVNLSSWRRIKRAFSSRHFTTDIASIAGVPPPLFICCSAAATWPYAYMVAFQQKVLL